MHYKFKRNIHICMKLNIKTVFLRFVYKNVIHYHIFKFSIVFIHYYIMLDNNYIFIYTCILVNKIILTCLYLGITIYYRIVNSIP